MLANQSLELLVEVEELGWIVANDSEPCWYVGFHMWAMCFMSSHVLPASVTVIFVTLLVHSGKTGTYARLTSVVRNVRILAPFPLIALAFIFCSYFTICCVLRQMVCNLIIYLKWAFPSANILRIPFFRIIKTEFRKLFKENKNSIHLGHYL